MSDSKWKQSLTAEQIQAAGFKPYEDTAKNSTLANDPTFEIIATAQINNFTSVKLCFSPQDPEHLYVVLADDPKWLHLPIDPTPEMLTKVYELYVKPTVDAAPQLPVEPDSLSQVAVLREAEGRVTLAGASIKTQKWYMGMGDYEDGMIEAENRYSINGWLSMELVRQATGNDGILSQWYSAFSRSLLTLTRVRVGTKTNNAIFSLEVQYNPSFHAKFTKSILEKNAHQTLVSAVSADTPLDVVGFLYKIDPRLMLSLDHLSKKVLAGEVDFFLALAVMTPDDTFEEVFLPLAISDNQQYRNFVAEEAVFRKNKKVFEVAKAKGISPEIIMAG